MNIKYICNAFSPQMITEDNYILKVETITEDEFNNIKSDTPSAVGHPDTARVLGVEFNRCNVKLTTGDTIAIAQLQNGRLPEGCTSLPEGFSFKYQLFTVCPPESENEKIRKAILTGLIDCRDAPDLGWSNFGGINIDECIAWLEKQGEKQL